MKIGIIGNGKMGLAVKNLAAEREIEVVAVVDEEGNEGGEAVANGALKGADVAIEFTYPAAAPANALACVRAGLPVVVGTTGWYDELEKIRAAVKESRGAVVWAPNFSTGVVLFANLVESAGRLFGGAGFDAHQIETHHRQKKDAPSGTAQALIEAFERGGGGPLPTTSVRVGSVPGTHEIHLDAPFEHICIQHQARDRRVFADGALRAAAWVQGRRGVFTMHDVLGITSAKVD